MDRRVIVNISCSNYSFCAVLLSTERAGHAMSSCPGKGAEILGNFDFFCVNLNANKRYYNEITFLYT